MLDTARSRNEDRCGLHSIETTCACSKPHKVCIRGVARVVIGSDQLVHCHGAKQQHDVGD